MKSRRRAPRALPSRGTHDLQDLSQLPCAPWRFVQALQPLKSPGPHGLPCCSLGGSDAGLCSAASPLLTESLLEPKQ